MGIVLVDNGFQVGTCERYELQKRYFRNFDDLDRVIKINQYLFIYLFIYCAKSIAMAQLFNLIHCKNTKCEDRVWQIP